jgi:hypothetical protein
LCSAQYGTVLYEQCNVTVDGEADLTHKLKFATGDLECFDSIGMFLLLNAKNRARKRNQGINKCEAIRFNELGCQGIDGTVVEGYPLGPLGGGRHKRCTDVLFGTMDFSPMVGGQR